MNFFSQLHSFVINYVALKLKNFESIFLNLSFWLCVSLVETLPQSASVCLIRHWVGIHKTSYAKL